MLNSKYFIIRKGDFATDANKKIYYTIFSILLCLDDYFMNNSIDCFRIMTGSTIVWSIIEFILHYTKTRIIKPMYLTNYYNNNKILMPRPLSIILQGSQEGGVVTTFGLYFGDRIHNLICLLYLHVFIGYIILNLCSKQNTSRVASKRHINNNGSLLTMTTITIYNMYNLYLYPRHIIRQIRMLFVMIYVCSVWTYIAYKKGFRDVETHYIQNSRTIVEKKSMYNTCFVLGYDVFFEIGIAYLTFYNLFIVKY